MRRPSSLASSGTSPAARRAASWVSGAGGIPAGLTVRRTGDSSTASSRASHSAGSSLGGHGRTGGLGHPHGQVGRQPGRRLGRAGGDAQGVDHPARVEGVADPPCPVVAQRRHPVLQRVLQGLGQDPALLVQGHRARGGHHGPQLAQAQLLAGRLGRGGPVLPIGQIDHRQQLLGDGQQRVGVGRPPRRVPGAARRWPGARPGCRRAAAARPPAAARDRGWPAGRCGGWWRRWACARARVPPRGGPSPRRSDGPPPSIRGSAASSVAGRPGPPPGPRRRPSRRPGPSRPRRVPRGRLGPARGRRRGSRVGAPHRVAQRRHDGRPVVIVAPAARPRGQGHRHVRAPLRGADDLDAVRPVPRRPSPAWPAGRRSRGPRVRTPPRPGRRRPPTPARGPDRVGQAALGLPGPGGAPRPDPVGVAGQLDLDTAGHAAITLSLRRAAPCHRRFRSAPGEAGGLPVAGTMRTAWQCPRPRRPLPEPCHGRPSAQEDPAMSDDAPDRDRERTTRPRGAGRPGRSARRQAGPLRRRRSGGPHGHDAAWPTVHRRANRRHPGQPLRRRRDPRWPRARPLAASGDRPVHPPSARRVPVTVPATRSHRRAPRPPVAAGTTCRLSAAGGGRPEHLRTRGRAVGCWSPW